MSPLPGCYRMYSTRYRGIPVRAVPISVITALISRKYSPLPRFFRGLLQYYRGIIHAAAVYTARASCDRQKWMLNVINCVAKLVGRTSTVATIVNF